MSTVDGICNRNRNSSKYDGTCTFNSGILSRIIFSAITIFDSDRVLIMLEIFDFCSYETFSSFDWTAERERPGRKTSGTRRAALRSATPLDDPSGKSDISKHRVFSGV